MEDHTSDWLRVVSISRLGQTMSSRTYRCVLCYLLGVPVFSVSKLCSTYSRVFAAYIYRDHAISCASIVAGKEVDIGLGKGRDKSLRLANMLLYSWDRGLDVCVDLTCSSPFTQTGMIKFAQGGAVIEAAQHIRELEKDAVTLLKRIRRFSVTQDVVTRVVVHIFNKIGFAIARGVRV
nr:hypothetical protein [Tanacetum cinerariifolium]